MKIENVVCQNGGHFGQGRWVNIMEADDLGPREHRKISKTRHIKSQNLNDSRLVLQLSLPNPLKPGVKSRMKM